MTEVIYLDHNATTPLLPSVVDAMLPYLREEYGNPSSDHAHGRRARAAVDTARGQLADLIGCHPDEIVFTSGGTEANNLAIRGTTQALTTSRRTVVTSAVEHPATVAPLRRMEAQGWTIDRLPVTREGSIDPSILPAAMTPDVALVTLMLAQNETGAMLPIAEAGEAAHAAGALMHTDAAQAIGKIPVHVDDLNVDLLSIAGHKVNAPKGVGALYIRRGTPIRPVLLGASQERGIRPGTENVASIVALGTAADAAATDIEQRAHHYRVLRNELWKDLSGSIPGLTRHTPVDSLPNTLSVSFPGVLGADVLARAPHIAASTGSACHSGTERPSAVLTAMGIAHTDAMGTVRLSLGHGNTAQDIVQVVRNLTQAFHEARP
ncbi:MAG: cysteine desulfurase family protein [Candidatus Nanopelagicales bacterium]